jgi:hypothetical protein
VFSEPNTKVSVRIAKTRSREVAIQITDRGVGMSEQKIRETNERLLNPPQLDADVTRRMGLYVVARLAKRHNIRVRLRANEDIDGGTVALVAIPENLVYPVAAPAYPAAAPTHPVVAQPYPVVAPTHPAARPSPASQPDTAEWPPPARPSPPAPPPPAPPLWQPHIPAEPAQSTPLSKDIVDDAAGTTARLPAYEAVLSQWFRPDKPTGMIDDEPAEPTPPPRDRNWRGPADEGWRRAESLLAPVGDVTSIGLPKRVPSAHLMPGSPSDQGQATPAASTPEVPSPRSADLIRRRMTRYQRGVREGRYAENTPDTPDTARRQP